MGASGYPVTLEQLGGSRITLALEGAAAPTTGMDDRLVRRIERDLMPGSDAPHDQDLGIDIPPMDLRGWFHDGAMGGTGEALEAVRKLRTICREGHIVRLTWGDVWQREGHVIEVNTPRHDDSLTRWSLTFLPQTIEDAPSSTIRAQRQVTDTELAVATAVLVAIDDTALNVQRAAAAAAWIRVVA